MKVDLRRIIKTFLIATLLCCTVSVHASAADELVDEIKKNLGADSRLALSLSDSLLKTGQRKGIDSLVAKGYYYLGLSNNYLSQIHLANENLSQALKTRFAGENDRFRADCLNAIGVMKFQESNYIEAYKKLNKARSLYEKMGDSAYMIKTDINMAMIEVKQKHFDKGEILIKSSLNYLIRNEEYQKAALCYQNLGNIFYEKKNLDSSIYYHEKAKDLFQTVGQPFGVAQSLFNKGIVFRTFEDTASAVVNLRSALKIAESIDFEELISQIYLHLYELGAYPAEDEYKVFNKAITVYEQNNNLEMLDFLYLRLSKYFVRDKNMPAYDSIMELYYANREKYLQQNDANKYEELKAVQRNEAQELQIMSQKEKIRNKNIWQISFAALLMIVTLLLSIFVYLYYRMNAYAKSLYVMNQEIQTAGILQMSRESSTPLEEDNQTNLPDELHEVSKQKELYDAIIALFETEKLYTQSDLTVSDLSRALNTNDKYISMAINSCSGGNFNSLVNAYRINEARRLIKEYGKTLAIKELANLSGFKSLNTFYKNFKEATGLTPSMYIEIATQVSVNE